MNLIGNFLGGVSWFVHELDMVLFYLGGFLV
jgi:hypothetical protein